MYGWGWGPYVSVAERRRKAEKAVAKMIKKGAKISPVRVAGRAIAGTFWGKAWCEQLESFSDYSNRLPRGRTYVRNGSVVHLEIESARISALVQGSSLYKVKIDIKSLDEKKWAAILELCSGKIDSVIELLQGRLSSGVMTTIIDRQHGLFPRPQEISFHCSCPDWANMCKHVAAVLYGVGSRLDNSPELLFKLRKVDHLELVGQAHLKTTGTGPAKARVLKDQDLSAVFGIELADRSAGLPEARGKNLPEDRSVVKRVVRRAGKRKNSKKVMARKGKRKARGAH